MIHGASALPSALEYRLAHRVDPIVGGGTGSTAASRGRAIAKVAMGWLLLLSANAAGCDGEPFMCRVADECRLGGEPGLCLGGSCAYPDAACASGYRYAAGVANALAGECVDANDPDEGSMADEPGSTGGSVPATSTSEGSTSVEPSVGESTSGREPNDDGSTSSMPSTDAVGSSGDEPPEDGSTTAPAPSCDALDCAGCFACVTEAGQACAMLDEDCDDATMCRASASCMWACAIKGICFDDCCGGLDGGDVSTAHDLHSCRAQACANACPDLPQPYCSG